MGTRWLVNGQPVGVSPADRGLAYGDGLFETMAAHAGQIRWLDFHLDRLADGCRRLEIPLPPVDAIRREIATICPATVSSVVKLIVTRGPGNRGYAPPAAVEPTRVVSVSPWPEYPARHYRDGITVCVCSLRLAESPVLAGLKHLNRLEQVLAQLELRGRAVEQGLLLDTSGHVVGGTSSNLFIVKSGALRTPALERSGIKGVMRRAVLAAAQELQLQVAEGELTLADTFAADEVFVTNALFGIWPVANIDSQRLVPGPITRRLMTHLSYGDTA